MSLLYKVAETATVTDEALEELLNRWTAEGWRFESVQFAMSPASKRPSMAFLVFTREGNRERAPGAVDADEGVKWGGR
jgi:hypothetical protein